MKPAHVVVCSPVRLVHLCEWVKIMILGSLMWTKKGRWTNYNNQHVYSINRQVDTLKFGYLSCCLDQVAVLVNHACIQKLVVNTFLSQMYNVLRWFTWKEYTCTIWTFYNLVQLTAIHPCLQDINPFAPGNFAEKRVLRILERVFWLPYDS